MTPLRRYSRAYGRYEITSGGWLLFWLLVLLAFIGLLVWSYVRAA